MVWTSINLTCCLAGHLVMVRVGCSKGYLRSYSYDDNFNSRAFETFTTFSDPFCFVTNRILSYGIGKIANFLQWKLFLVKNFSSTIHNIWIKIYDTWPKSNEYQYHNRCNTKKITKKNWKYKNSKSYLSSKARSLAQLVLLSAYKSESSAPKIFFILKIFCFIWITGLVLKWSIDVHETSIVGLTWIENVYLICCIDYAWKRFRSQGSVERDGTRTE